MLIPTVVIFLSPLIQTEIVHAVIKLYRRWAVSAFGLLPLILFKAEACTRVRWKPFRSASFCLLAENKFSSFSSPTGAQQHQQQQQHLITPSLTLDCGESSKIHSASASPTRICPITSVSHRLPHWHLSSFHISQVSFGHKGDHSMGRQCIHFHH